MLPTGGPMKIRKLNNHKKHNPGFMFYQAPNEKTITEWCSNCTTEVEIESIAQVQACPECGEPIWPCSLCDHNRVKCSQCILI